MTWLRCIAWAFIASSYLWSMGGANAAGVDPRPFYVQNGFQVVGNAIARHLPFTFSNASGGAGAVASLPITARVGGAVDVPFTMKRSAPWPALLRTAGRALPLVGTATAVYDLAEALRCSWNGSGIECEEGVPPSTVTVWEYSPQGVSTPPRFREESAVANWWIANDSGLQAGQTTGVSHYVGGVAQFITCNHAWAFDRVANAWGGNASNSLIYARTGTVYNSNSRTCVAATGTSTRGIVRSESQTQGCANGEPTGPDGNCPGGSKVVLTPEDFSSRFSPHFPPSAGQQPAGTPSPADVARDAWSIGEDIGQEFGPIEISGPPQTSAPPKVTTTTNPDGSTSTTTTTNTYTYNYAGDTVIWNVSTRTEHPDGTVEETTPDPEIPTPNDPSMPAQPELYTRKYPQGLVGVWNEKSADLKQTPIFAFLQQLVPNTGDGGCPQWSIPSGNLFGVSVGGDVSIPCFVWSAIRLIMIIGALLLARALIFGG